MIFKLKLVLMAFLALLLIACGADEADTEATHTHSDGSTHAEHSEDAEATEETTEGGEEDGTQYTKADTHDKIRNGIRLVLKFDAEQGAFTGTVENVSEETLKAVRVEVHLSNGLELGPTESSDLAPGEVKEVMLTAEGREFETWSTHPETGEGEHAGEGSENEGHSHGEEEGEHTHG